MGNPAPDHPEDAALLEAVRHAFFWMVIANGAGVLLAVLLVVPDGNLLLGEWSYGRWIPVHLNLQLYGWSSLPLVAWLIKIYRVDEVGLGRWGTLAVWGWSAALVVGAMSWLGGESSGKIFLDWTGLSLRVFVVAMLLLWGVTAAGWWKSGRGWARLIGVAALATVPASMVFAASRTVYPPVNPDTGGPTGASLLGSTLIVIFLLLLVPRSLGKRRLPGRRSDRWFWIVFGVEFACFALLERPAASHRQPEQWLGLGLLLVWVPLLPMFYRGYAWDAGERHWMWAFLAWLGLLIVSGWVAFLPGVLDGAKFTNALVGHSHLAMAGFTSSFLVFLAVVLTGAAEVLRRGFWWWHLAALAYVVLMVIAGANEAVDAGWVMEGGLGRDVVYVLRLLCGVVLFGVSVRWFQDLVASGAMGWKGVPVRS